MVCGKPILGKRKDAKTCSANCRSKAYYHRKQAERIYKKNVLDMFNQQDINRIRTISEMAADTCNRVAMVGGKELAESVIDGMFDLLSQCKVYFTN